MKANWAEKLQNKGIHTIKQNKGGIIMSGKAIGKNFDLGYAGNVSRNRDTVIVARVVKEETESILFGQAVVLNEDNTIQKIGADNTQEQCIGIAVREVKQTTNYITSEGAYHAGDACSILTRGCITVKCNKGTPKAGGKVYVRVEEDENMENGGVGEFEAEQDTGNIALENVIFTTGQIDKNNIAEITVLARRI